MKSLFIGGVADGRWMEHDSSQSIINLARYPKTVFNFSEPPPEFVVAERDEYRRHSFYGQHTFFALISLNSEDVIRKLIENYRPVTETGNLK